MTKKSPARLTDETNHNSNGQGTITTIGTPTTTFEGQPVACEGDTMEFGNGQTSLIPPGNGCVMINGRRIALMGDGDPGNTGMITLGAPTIQVAEGDPFAFLGENVQLGPNVEFNAKTQNSSTDTPQNEKYDYYLVDSDGAKQQLAVFGVWNILDVTNIDITDYFEEERLSAGSSERGISQSGRKMAVATGLLLAAASPANKISLRVQLLKRLNNLHPQIRAKMPSTGGVVLQAIYKVSSDGEVTTFYLQELDILDATTDYVTYLNNWITQPHYETEPDSAFVKLDHLYIWAVKQ